MVRYRLSPHPRSALPLTWLLARTKQIEQGEGEEVQYVADLENDGDKVLLASGGKPGLGNLHVASRKVGTVSDRRCIFPPGERGRG